jgi:transposase
MAAKQAISYCGLCSAEKSSGEKVMRTPISKKRNKHIHQVLVEAAQPGTPGACSLI